MFMMLRIQGAAAPYLKAGLLERHLPRIRAACREQAHTMVGARHAAA
jgi:hypothetical protein